MSLFQVTESQITKLKQVNKLFLCFLFDTRDANDDLTLRLVTVTTSAELLSLSANTLEVFTLSFSIRLHSAGQEEPDTLFMVCLWLSLCLSLFLECMSAVHVQECFLNEICSQCRLPREHPVFSQIKMPVSPSGWILGSSDMNVNIFQ